MFKFTRLLAIPVLAALALTAPSVVAPREVPAVHAATLIGNLGPYKTYEQANEIAQANQAIGYLTQVILWPADLKWHVLIFAP
jgi:hypothetical protein